MSKHIPIFLDELVRKRAAYFCEYCQLPQSSQEATFHLDHIQPRFARGATRAENLALACVTCSLKKAARTHARDPISNKLVRLFNPRQDCWSAHFRWSGACRLIGRTGTGRATIIALGMNRPNIIAIRQTLLMLGRMSLGE